MFARERFGFVAVCCGLLLGALGPIPALAGTARLEAVGRMLERNAQELARYSWKSRTEIRVEGELVQTTLVRASYDRVGMLVETPLPGDAGTAQGSKKLKKKVLTFHEELRALTRSYFDLDPQRIQAALDRAHAWEGQGEQGNLLRVQARGVIRQGDTLDLWIDSATNHPRRLDVLTSLQGEPVRLTAEFAQLKDGPSYAVKTLVETELKEKKMVVRTASFDHVARDD
jgi:hypothetical protein